MYNHSKWTGLFFCTKFCMKLLVNKLWVNAVLSRFSCPAFIGWVRLLQRSEMHLHPLKSGRVRQRGCHSNIFDHPGALSLPQTQVDESGMQVSPVRTAWVCWLNTFLRP